MGNYQGYQKYKDSGVVWLGDIPEHWEQKRFKFSVNLINNKIEAENSNLSYMGLEHIESWTGKKIEDKNASSEGIGSHFLPNDVLFGKLRPYLAKVYLSDIEGLASTEALVLRCKNNIFPKFLKYYILSRDFINIVDSSTFGAKMPRASWDFIGNLFFIFPPLNEQQKIAQFLDYKTKQIDELIKKKETLIEKLDEKRTAVISHAVTKGLDSSVPMKDSCIEWLGEIPKHWKVKRLKNIASCNDESLGENTAPDFEIEYVDISSVDLVSGIRHYENMTFEKAPSRARRKVQDGDTIISTVRTYLKSIAAIKQPPINLIVSTGFAVIRPKININSNYIGYLLQSEGFVGKVVSNSVGVSYPAINSSVLISLPVVEPPINEQQKIAQFLDYKTAQIDKQKAKIKQAIELLKEYRTSLITNAVTGKIDVSQVDIP
jgi:type I restriction enzyme S subunit